MIKLIKYLLLVISLTSCTTYKPNGYREFLGIKCEPKFNNIMNNYVFNKETGDLFFYDDESKKFKPLSLKYEFGNFSEITPEIKTKLKGHKLIIESLTYSNTTPQITYKKKIFINLKTLYKKTILIDSYGKHKYSKVKCFWIDPRLVIQ